MPRETLGPEDDNGVLDENPPIGTTAIGIVGTAHVPIAISVNEDDDADLVEDDAPAEPHHEPLRAAEPALVTAEAEIIEDDAEIVEEPEVVEEPAALEEPETVDEPAAHEPEVEEAPADALPQDDATDAEAPADIDAASVEPGAADEFDAAPVFDAEPAPEPAPEPEPEPEPATRATTRANQIVRQTRGDEAVPAAAPASMPARRIGELTDGAARETSDQLTAERLLDAGSTPSPEPEGGVRRLLHRVSGGRFGAKETERARRRRETDEAIGAPLTGGARFVAVLSRKGGVGKTTTTTLLGMALADVREDRVVAIDANPDRGTLADRIARGSGFSVRDLVREAPGLRGYNDLSAIVARDETRLDVIASDTGPHVVTEFDADEYAAVADVARHYYSLVLTDTGTGLVHSVMGATLAAADALVIVAGQGIDEARLASETLTWLEANGYGALARRAVVVLNTTSPANTLVRRSEIEAHFQTRVARVVQIPYDAVLAQGGPISFRVLSAGTREAARAVAGAVVAQLQGETVGANGGSAR